MFIYPYFPFSKAKSIERKTRFNPTDKMSSISHCTLPSQDNTFFSFLMSIFFSLLHPNNISYILPHLFIHSFKIKTP